MKRAPILLACIWVSFCGGCVSGLRHIFETIGQSSAVDRCFKDAVKDLSFDPLPHGLVAEVEYPVEFRDSHARLPASATTD